jgi:hypothetical protein
MNRRVFSSERTSRSGGLARRRLCRSAGRSVPCYHQAQRIPAHLRLLVGASRANPAGIRVSADALGS